MTKDGYGSFGAQATQYGAARQEFPEAIFEYLKKRAAPRIRLLDVGCGTGIPSRQMAGYGFRVTGSDIDERMIKKAIADSPNNEIEYIVAPVHVLPFGDNSFSIVTAFSAFHWFCDEVSIREIKRILSDYGLLFVVNKNETGDMKKIIKSALKPFMMDEALPPDAKAAYDPAAIMAQYGFVDIQERVIPVVEEYSVDGAVVYAQSMSIWNLVQTEKREKAIEILRDEFVSHAKDGIMHRPLEIKAVSGVIRK